MNKNEYESKLGNIAANLNLKQSSQYSVPKELSAKRRVVMPIILALLFILLTFYSEPNNKMLSNSVGNSAVLSDEYKDKINYYKDSGVSFILSNVEKEKALEIAEFNHTSSIVPFYELDFKTRAGGNIVLVDDFTSLSKTVYNPSRIIHDTTDEQSNTVYIDYAYHKKYNVSIGGKVSIMVNNREVLYTVSRIYRTSYYSQNTNGVVLLEYKGLIKSELDKTRGVLNPSWYEVVSKNKTLALNYVESKFLNARVVDFSNYTELVTKHTNTFLVLFRVVVASIVCLLVIIGTIFINRNNIREGIERGYTHKKQPQRVFVTHPLLIFTVLTISASSIIIYVTKSNVAPRVDLNPWLALIFVILPLITCSIITFFMSNRMVKSYTIKK